MAADEEVVVLECGMERLSQIKLVIHFHQHRTKLRQQQQQKQRAIKIA